MNIESMNVITLAYLGDSVYEVYIREYLISKGIVYVVDLQKEAIKYVSAKSQAKILDYLVNNNYLSEEEVNIVKRGRNYKRDSHPKNTDIIAYKKSTGFECLVGYLYLSKNINRLDEIMNIIKEEYVYE